MLQLKIILFIMVRFFLDLTDDDLKKNPNPYAYDEEQLLYTLQTY